MNQHKRRWYGILGSYEGKQARIQLHRRDYGKSSDTLPEPIVRAAAAEYNRQGFSQSFERLQERGGLSDTEIIALLADALGIEVPEWPSN
jgi:hypothetical protein